MTSTYYCPSCGTKLPVYARFCRQCGREFKTSVTNSNITQKFPAVGTRDDTTQKLVRGVYKPSPTHSTTTSRVSNLYPKVVKRLPKLVQYLIVAMLTHVEDTNPENPLMNMQSVAQGINLGLFPLLALTNAVGVSLVAYAYTTARYGATNVDVFFWLGILLIFVPSAVRLLSLAVSRTERICLLCAATTCFYLVNAMSSPLSFSGFDEFLHWRTADDIARSGHLFSTNTLLPASPFYPGLEIVTNALSRLTGLSTFLAGIIVVGVAHLLLILSLFLLYEQITQSPRIGGIAAALYMTNPHFLFFDSAFSYESLALPLATFVLFTLANYMKLNNKHGWIMSSTWLTLGAITVTHHMTDFVLDGLLLLWAVTDGLQQRTRLRQSSIVWIALFGVFIAVAWIGLKGNPVVEYLSSYFKTAFDELSQIVTGTSHARKLFTTYSGQAAPFWERVVAIFSVALIALSLPFGLLCLWQRYRRNTLALMFGIVALAYPVTQVFRFTNFGSEITDRAAAFLFIPISCVLAIFITQFWPIRTLRWQQTSVISAALAILFLGGVVLEAGPPWALLPGPYLVAADARSIEPEGIQTARWTFSRLGPNNSVATDRINEILMTTYGDQSVVTYLAKHIDVTPVFFSSQFSSEDVSILRHTKIRYIVVDLRLSTSLPGLGFYFAPGEPNSFQHITPIARNALTKFNTVPQINRIFDSGNIVIYDVGGLVNAPQKP